MSKPKVLPVTGVATVVGLHDLPEPTDMPVLTAEPVIAWAVKNRKMKALDHSAQYLISMHPITPGNDGVPMPFDACTHTLGWIVVHGILTMSTLRDQIPMLVSTALTDFCIEAENRGNHYVDSDGLTDTSPEALLHGKGKWMTENTMMAEFLDVTTAKLVKLSDLVEDEDFDMDQFTMSEDLLRLVVH